MDSRRGSVTLRLATSRWRGAAALALLTLAACQGRQADVPSGHGVAGRSDASKGPNATGAPIWMRRARLEGQVTAQGKPLPSAELSLTLLLGPRQVKVGSVRSDAAGAFRFERLPPGAYALDTRQPGRASRRLSLWVDPGLTRVPLLDLERSALLSGRAIDEQGHGIPRARITAAPAGGSPDWRLTALSDANGSFVVDGLQQGVYRLTAEADGHRPALRAEVVTPVAGLDLRLVRYFRLRGRVTGGSGAIVRLAGSGIWPPRQAETDSDGGFLFPDVPAGIYELEAHRDVAPWLASETLGDVRAGPADPPLITLQLKPAHLVKGTVLHKGRPVPAAVLSLAPGMAAALQTRTTCDAEGRFGFAPVIGSELRLSAWAPGFVPVIGLEIRQGHTGDLRINLSRGGTIRGTVTDAQGAPVAGVFLWARPRDAAATLPRGVLASGELGVVPGPVPPIPLPGTFPAVGSLAGGRPTPRGEAGTLSSSAPSDAKGDFVLRGLRPGQLQVVADHPQYLRASSEWVEVADEEEVKLRLALRPGGELLGRVLDPRGEPIPGARVVGRSGEGPTVAVSDALGSYSLRGLSGAVTVTASRAGYVAVSKRERVPEGARRELDLVLEVGQGEASGFVYGPGREPIAGAEVSASSGEHRVQALTDGRGYFELHGLPARVMALSVTHPRFMAVHRTLRAGDRIELHLGSTTTLAGRVRESRTGASVNRFSVEVRGAGAHRRTSVHNRQGLFEIRGLGAGAAILQVDAPGFALKSQSIDLADPETSRGRPNELEVLLERAGAIEGTVTRANGQPEAGAAVSCAGVGTATGAGGEFKLARVPEGLCAVEVSARDGQSARSDPVVVRADATAGPVRILLR